MKENISKFKSNSAFEAWKASDGWSYPSVSFIEGKNNTYDVKYNGGSRELIMRWYDADPVKKLYFMGNMSRPEFREWLANAWAPCEVYRTERYTFNSPYEFNYLYKPDIRYYATSFSGLVKKGTDKSKVFLEDVTVSSSGSTLNPLFQALQMVELKNINVGLFQNSVGGYKEVRFNFDKGCPEGFHRWFTHPYWNESIGSYTKLVGRYDLMPCYNGLNSNMGVFSAYRGSFSHASFVSTTPIDEWRYRYTINGDGDITWSRRNTSPAGICRYYFGDSSSEGGKNYGFSDIQLWTYWEQLVLRYVAMAALGGEETNDFMSSFSGGPESVYFTGGGFNSTPPEEVCGRTYPGCVEADSNYDVISSNSRGDSILRKTDGVDSSNASGSSYTFLGIQDALSGIQDLFCIGAWLSGDDSKYYISYNDKYRCFDSDAYYMPYFDKSIDVTIPLKKSTGWVSNMDLFGLPTTGPASSSTGICCPSYINTNASNPTSMGETTSLSPWTFFCLCTGGSMTHSFDGRPDLRPGPNFCSLIRYNAMSGFLRSRLTFLRE